MARSRTPQNRRPTSGAAIGNARVFRALSREAIQVRRTPTGDVGLLYSGEGIEAVWVSKKAEKIDRRWFQYPRVDVLAVLRGRLKVEFRSGRPKPRVLRAGDVLVLPPIFPQN
jgi:mannose-6-phosphate isomerase-like protein (cupin superfamily)